MRLSMSKAVIYFVVIGVGIGAMMPSGQTPATADPAEAVGAGTRDPVASRIPRAPNGHFYVDATVNGRLVRFMVDTGATMVALSADDAKRVGAPFDPADFEVIGSGASGEVRGQEIRIASIEIEGKLVSNVGGVVADGLDQSLLGQNYLSRMGNIEMNADEMVIHPPA
jgi:aspartyl protease family protein